MAAALLARRLDDAGVDATVTSAGTRQAGLPVDPDAVAALAELGVDLSGHRPRPLDAGILAADGRDLVITMTREQLRVVATTGPGTFRRAFTLRELVRRLGSVPGTTSWDEALQALGRDRRPSELVRDDVRDDVEDPYGLGRRAVRGVADELELLVRPVVAHLPWDDISGTGG
jgi:protein-tyrosine-phosphatase